MKFNRPLVFVLPLAIALVPGASFAQLTTTTTTTGTGGSSPPMCSAGLLAIQLVTNSSDRSTSESPLTISQSDCEQKARLGFQYSYHGTPTFTIRAYAMRKNSSNDLPDCLTQQNRNDSDCQLLASRQVGSTGGTFSLAARSFLDVLSQHSCHDSLDGEQTSVPIWIEVVDSNEDDAVDYCTYTVQLALTGPTPPSDLTAGPGDKALVLSFTSLEDPSTVSYNVYCDDGSGVPSQGGGGSGGSGTGSGGSGGSGGSDIFGGFHPGPQSLGTGGAGGFGGSGAGGETQIVTPPPQGCTFSKVLVAGKPPPDDASYFAGTSNSTLITAKTASGRTMKNGQEYACAIAAIDTVGNIGNLSNVACGIPEPNDDFFGEYRGDSGLAGGGLCTVGRSSSALAAMSAALGASLLALAARRRSRPKGRRGRS